MTSEQEDQLANVLDKAAQKLHFKQYEIEMDMNGNRGDGYLGELFKAALIEPPRKVDLILKKAPTVKRHRDQNCVEEAYQNEILFYSELYPRLRRFEDEHQVRNPFVFLPRYVTSSEEVGAEIIVLEDLTAEGFEMVERNQLLDADHAELIFKIYAHFHAISFCLKKEKPEEYRMLTGKCFDIFRKLAEKLNFQVVLINTVKQCFELLDPEEDKVVREKFRKYVEGTVEMFSESLKYDGEFSGILHGDCWSNNMMFKYQDSKLVDMRLLDFQIVKVGTPVFDLSHFFYSGGSKALFDRLDHFLDVYYRSFSESVKNLHGDPEQLLPRGELIRDWKNHAKYGMLMALILVRVKLANRSDSLQLTDENAKHLFKRRVRDILIHMSEIDAL